MFLNIFDVIYPDTAGYEVVLAIIEKEGLNFKLSYFSLTRIDELAFIESLDRFLCI